MIQRYEPKAGDLIRLGDSSAICLVLSVKEYQFEFQDIHTLTVGHWSMRWWSLDPRLISRPEDEEQA